MGIGRGAGEVKEEASGFLVGAGGDARAINIDGEVQEGALLGRFLNLPMETAEAFEFLLEGSPMFAGAGVLHAAYPEAKDAVDEAVEADGVQVGGGL